MVTCLTKHDTGVLVLLMQLPASSLRRLLYLKHCRISNWKLQTFMFRFRSLDARYAGPTVYKGIKGNIYSADFGDMANDPDLKCFCTTPKSCLKRGVHDLRRCTGKSH